MPSWILDLLRRLSLPARLVFLSVSAGIAIWMTIVAAVSVWEADAQFGLVPVFAVIYVAIAYIVVRGADAAVRTVVRRLSSRRD
jgi:hypothetical protein